MLSLQTMRSCKLISRAGWREHRRERALLLIRLHHLRSMETERNVDDTSYRVLRARSPRKRDETDIIG